MTENEAWERVRAGLVDAKAIAWDECHKIYVLMDDEQVDQMKVYGYDPLIPVTDQAEALKTVRDWWNESCGLRFVSAIKTVAGDPNKGFTDLIAQFDEEGW